MFSFCSVLSPPFSNRLFSMSVFRISTWTTRHDVVVVDNRTPRRATISAATIPIRIPDTPMIGSTGKWGYESEKRGVERLAIITRRLH